LRKSITGCMLTSLKVVRIAGGRLRLQQALGDARAQSRHRHALFGTVGEDLLNADWSWRMRQRGLCRGGAPPAQAGFFAPSTSPLVTRPRGPHACNGRCVDALLFGAAFSPPA